MRVLCLDIGTNMGWAAASLDAPPLPAPLLGDERPAKSALRHYRYGLWRGPSGDHGRFYHEQSLWLADMLRTLRASLLAYEFNAAGVAQMRSADAAMKTFGIVAEIRRVAHVAGLPTKMVHTASMQKLAVGTGRDSGKVKRKARLAALGLGNIDNNTGDAIFALSWVLHDRQAARQAREAA